LPTPRSKPCNRTDYQLLIRKECTIPNFFLESPASEPVSRQQETLFEHRGNIRSQQPNGHKHAHVHVDRAEDKMENFHVNRPDESVNRIWQAVETRESSAWHRYRALYRNGSLALAVIPCPTTLEQQLALDLGNKALQHRSLCAFYLLSNQRQHTETT
jgi:hypothetical protein